MNVPIPKRMEKLPRDKRGLPIPVIVLGDNFAVNDYEKMVSVLLDDRCSVCGDKLLRGRWFVGGPLSAFHPSGAFNDGPLHGECKTYALQVCPWLALPRYAKAIGPTLVERNPDWRDHTTMPGRPDPFVAVLARGQTILAPAALGGAYSVVPLRPYIRVEVWRHGALMEKEEGFKMAMNRVAAYDKEMANGN